MSKNLSQLKIAFLNYTIGIVERGGELGIQMLAEDLARLGHKVDVYQSKKLSTPASYNQIIISLPVLPTSHKPTTLIGKVLDRLYLDKNGLLTLLFSLKALPQLLRNHYDIYFPVNGFWQILVCKLVKFLNSGKIVVSGKAGIGWTDRDNLRLRPDIFIPISKTAAEWAQTINPQLPIKYIPEQIDHSLFNPKIKPEKIPLPSPIILSVAALTKYKRVDAIIKAVSLLKNASLLVIGHGEEYDYLYRLGKRLLPQRFLVQSVSYHKLPSIYTACNVFTFASEPQEAFGRVLIEALACGLPVVTTDDPLRRSLLDKAAIYTDVTNPKLYAQDLSRALSNPPSKQNLINYTKQFDRLKVARQYHQLFQTLVDR